ncbi:PqqD family protein [Terriglobus roseus]|uniref:Coenzyme PQQ synthesis protein D (PqqD) n=1 Tax=Terriglobus roseus TaxID=392734 RepID=A0A1H4RP21_9BACT|nr:PqqD family protein [Terriglobus roseus]SEC33665.1 Coenzyme PQQ synthesis protein D (PqqD) [Terriglobus roseus]
MTLDIQGRTIVSRGEGWLTAWVGQEYVMMSAETGTCISLSETGGRIWELMEHSRSVDSLCKELGEEYQAELGVVDHDVLVFLENLQAEGAIVATDPAER